MKAALTKGAVLSIIPKSNPIKNEDRRKDEQSDF